MLGRIVYYGTQFYIHGPVNTHNCDVWDSQNSHVFQQIPLQPSKVTVWCGLSESFLVNNYHWISGGKGKLTETQS